MSDEVELLKTLAEMAYERFDEATKALSEKELDWRPLEETNSLRWIFTHLSQQWNVGIPRILRGDPEYKPKDWPDDYIDNQSYTLKKLMDEMEQGKNHVMKGLRELTPAALKAKIPLWGGTRTRQFGLLIYLSEIFHHVGQIAYVRGAIGRRRQTDKHFLT